MSTSTYGLIMNTLDYVCNYGIKNTVHQINCELTNMTCLELSVYHV